MDLVVTTPGVSTAVLRPPLESESREGPLVIDRATRCGSTTVDPTTASRLRLAVAPCAVSLHAADRVRRRLEQSVDGVIVCRGHRSPSGSRLDERFDERFDCPVSIHTSNGDHVRRPRYSMR